MKKNIVKRLVVFLSIACLCVGFGSCKVKDKIDDWIDSEVDKIVDSVVGDVSTSDSDSSFIEDDSSVSGGSSSSSGDDKVNVELNKPVGTGLISPSNESTLIENSVTALEGAALYMSSARPALKFTFRSTKTMAEFVDNGFSLVCTIVPLNVFDKVNTSAYTYVNWYKEIRDAGLGSQCVVLNFEEKAGDGYSDFYCTFTDIAYENINTKYIAVACVFSFGVETLEGMIETMKYNAFPPGIDYRSNARSVSMVAGAALNAYTLGLATFTDSNLNTLKSYINESVDQANGLSAATSDGSIYTVSIDSGATSALAVDEYLPLKIALSPAVDIPILYRSTDKSIVTVDDYGNVKGVSAGTAIIRVYVAGEITKITVTVT